MPSLTPPPSHLDDDQIERLAELLDQRAVPFKGFNLAADAAYAAEGPFFIFR